MTTSADFYNELEPFSDFSDLTDRRHFKAAPGDWVVFLTDVRGSTAAIESGRYKDVNVIGGAAIACVQNVLGGVEFPYVFGGDGATLLTPAPYKESVAKALSSLAHLSSKNFNLNLRVGVVDVNEIKQQGFEIEIAKFKLAGAKTVAIFRGGGLAKAEALVKSGAEKYQVDISTSHAQEASLDGLSCRWKPIPNRNGAVLSLLVVARTNPHEEIYARCLKNLEDILGGPLDSANPIAPVNMTYRSFWQCLRDEVRWQKNIFSKAFRARLIQVIFSYLIFNLKVLAGPFKAKEYNESLPAHSDYRKFDDALRMVIDCTPDQITKIRDHLTAAHAKGELYFGLHESKTSLMTCLVQSLDYGHHVHFIDGGDGGYAVAAKQMKGQMKG